MNPSQIIIDEWSEIAFVSDVKPPHGNPSTMLAIAAIRALTAPQVDKLYRETFTEVERCRHHTLVKRKWLLGVLNKTAKGYRIERLQMGSNKSSLMIHYGYAKVPIQPFDWWRKCGKQEAVGIRSIWLMLKVLENS